MEPGLEPLDFIKEVMCSPIFIKVNQKNHKLRTISSENQNLITRKLFGLLKTPSDILGFQIPAISATLQTATIYRDPDPSRDDSLQLYEKKENREWKGTVIPG